MQIRSTRMKKGTLIELTENYRSLLQTLKMKTSKSYRALIMESLELLACEYGIIEKPKEIFLPVP